MTAFKPWVSRAAQNLERQKSTHCSHSLVSTATAAHAPEWSFVGWVGNDSRSPLSDRNRMLRLVRAASPRMSVIRKLRKKLTIPDNTLPLFQTPPSACV